MQIYLNQIAHGRSGDKGDTSNVCVFARKPEYYAVIAREVTPQRVKAHFGDMVKGEIVRYDVPSLQGFNFKQEDIFLHPVHMGRRLMPHPLQGFNFVMKHALGGGATHSLRLDSLGKSMGSALLRMKIEVGEGEIG